MRMKGLILRQLVIGISGVLLLSTLSSAISVKSQDKKSKVKADENVKFVGSHDETSYEKVLERQGLFSEDDDNIDTTLDSKELVKKAQNVTESKAAGKRKKEKEHSPPASVDVIPPAELEVDDDNSDEEGERLAKADLNRESRGDKNPRIYYDDAVPRYPSSHSRDSPFEHSAPEAKSKDGKLYFPKNYLNSKYSPGSKKGHKSSLVGLSGKRIPDHVHFDEGGHAAHEFSPGHGPSHQHPVIGHHEESGPADDSPYPHGVEEDFGKGHHHVSGYGYHHHHGSYRHTLGDKVDAFGKALQVLLPSALLITGVSALFPNRVHVPTTPNKYRQKRSVFGQRMGARGMMPPHALLRMPASHIPPELEDIPTHILHAEHRIMDGNPAEIYPEYGKRYGAPISAESTGFNPFKVFKGPGPETQMMHKIKNAIALPPFPPLPELADYPAPQGVDSVEGVVQPAVNFRPESIEVEALPPTVSAPLQVVPQPSPPTSTLDELGQDVEFMKQRQNLPLRRRKPIRKAPVYLKEATKVQQSSESQKSQYSVKNTLDDSNSKLLSQIKAEKEFMSSLKNLVTPDVAKAIVENKQEAPKEVDLSPDGPVMGLLTSYAQHENDTPACQKRALCELAVKGKDPKSTKFEAFLWSVATLVPDVFSEMYDLQEVFQSIREEHCNKFACINPNMDLQV